MLNNPTNTANWFIDQLNFYQSSSSNAESIKKNFVIRKEEFELIIADLLNKKGDDPLQHELFLGRRGSGKSTLLRRIQIEIDENQDLSNKYIAINLAEEQAGIYRLFDLWIEVLKELSIRFNQPLNLEDYSSFKDGHEYTKYLYEEIIKILSNGKKKVILLLDNLDRIVENFDDDGNLLRENLLNHNNIQIIGGSTRMDEHFWKYDQPFYEFFRRHRLGSLSTLEIHLLLNYWSKIMNLPQLSEFSKANKGKIEALRILTDGLPRTLQFFIQILLQDSTLYGFDYIKKVMDNVTPLYQERLNNSPAPQRKIVLEMAFFWEAASTKQLAERCRMESKLISAQLKQLTNNGLVETITTNKKNHLYRLSERFFNMWLLVTQGNMEQKRRAKWLTIFLETWYDAAQLKTLAIQHIDNLQSNSLSYEKAFIMTKALSQSKYTHTSIRDTMLDFTSKFADAKTKNDLFELPRKYSDIKAEIQKAINDNKIKSAHNIVDEIENEDDGVKFRMKGYLFSIETKFNEAEKYYLLAIETGDLYALNSLANVYAEQKKFVEAETYYLMAIERGDSRAICNLANTYLKQKEFAKAEKYYLLAIEKGNIDALNNLAGDFAQQKKFAEVEKYNLLAIEKDNTYALENLAIDYLNQNKFAEAEQYYQPAIKKGNIKTTTNLASANVAHKDFVEAGQYNLSTIEKRKTEALNNLAFLYYSNNHNKNKALELLEQSNLNYVDQDTMEFKFIVEIWNGRFQNVDNKLNDIIAKSKYEHLSWFIENLLVQQQTQLVLMLFKESENRKELQEKYQLFYYAVLILNNEDVENLQLRIAPEVLPTVLLIVEKIIKLRLFYSESN